MTLQLSRGEPGNKRELHPTIQHGVRTRRALRSASSSLPPAHALNAISVAAAAQRQLGLPIVDGDDRQVQRDVNRAGGLWAEKSDVGGRSRDEATWLLRRRRLARPRVDLLVVNEVASALRSASHRERWWWSRGIDLCWCEKSAASTSAVVF